MQTEIAYVSSHMVQLAERLSREERYDEGIEIEELENEKVINK